MNSPYCEERSVVAERFLRTLKNKTNEHMTSITKNVCIDKLVDIVNKCNKTYQSTIKMKPVDINSSTYIDVGRRLRTKSFFSFFFLLEQIAHLHIELTKS